MVTCVIFDDFLHLKLSSPFFQYLIKINTNSKFCKLYNKFPSHQMISFLPVGGLLFIIEFPVEDTWEEAEEAVIVGGEGDDEN